MGLFSKKSKKEDPVTNPVLETMKERRTNAAPASVQQAPQQNQQGSANVLQQVMLTPPDLYSMPVWSWVWIECISPFDNPLQQSAYYRKVPEKSGNINDTFFCGYPGCVFGFNYATYGTEWVAYKYQP